MQTDDRDAGYLWDIVDAARAVQGFVVGVSFEGYLGSRMLQAAVERNVEIIGEAARKLSRQFKDGHPEIPWQSIVAQRHVLAHEYGEIKQDRIWRVATVHIPDLIAKLEPLIPPEPPADP